MSAELPEAVPQRPVFETIEAAQTYLDDPEQRDRILLTNSFRCKSKLEEYLSVAEERQTNRVPEKKVFDLNPAMFQILFDPALATIAIDVEQCFESSELVAMAAQQRRTAGKPSCNIILFPSSTSCGSIALTESGERQLEITHGIFISEDGFVFQGELPIPARVDMVETADSAFRDQCTKRGVSTINRADIAAICNSKADLNPYLEGTSVRMPERFTPEQLWQDDPEAEYVIKPSNASGGRGVRMYLGVNQKANAHAYYAFLKESGYEPVIERRIRSYPVRWNVGSGEGPRVRLGGEFVPVSGPSERRDWNVRAILAGGRLVDMYVRMDDWGNPVNRASGAKALSMTDFAWQVGDPTEATRLYESLVGAANDIARTIPTGISGIDITIDEAGQPYVYEVNVGQLGGLQTIALLHDDPEQKLSSSHAIIESWLNYFDLNRQPTMRYDTLALRVLRHIGLESWPPSTPRSISREPLSRSITSLYCGSGNLKNVGVLADLPEAEVQRLNPTGMEYVYWLRARYIAAREDKSIDQIRELDNAYDRLAPLEFAIDLGNIAEGHPSPQDLARFLPRYEPLFPNTLSLEYVRMFATAAGHLPDRVLDSCIKLIQNGESVPWTVRIGAAVLIRNAYDRFDFDDERTQLDMHDLSGVYPVYLTEGPDAALEALHATLNVTADSVGRRVLAAAGVELSLASGNLSALSQFREELAGTDWFARLVRARSSAGV